MIDSSLVDYFLRMQGRNIAVRLDPKLLKKDVGTPTQDNSAMNFMYEKYNQQFDYADTPGTYGMMMQLASEFAGKYYYYVVFNEIEVSEEEFYNEEGDEYDTDVAWVSAYFGADAPYFQVHETKPYVCEAPWPMYVGSGSLGFLGVAKHILDYGTMPDGMTLGFFGSNGKMSYVYSSESLERFAERLKYAASIHNILNIWAFIQPQSTVIDLGAAFKEMKENGLLDMNWVNGKNAALLKKWSYSYIPWKNTWNSSYGKTHLADTVTSIGDGWFDYAIPLLFVEDDEDIVEDFHKFLMEQMQ